MTLARHTDYIREVQADQDRLLSAAQLQVNDKDDDWETDTDNMLKVVTVKDLEGFCSETVSLIHDYDTIVLQDWKRVLVAILSQFPNKLHCHGHAYLLQDKECFQKRSGLINEELPIALIRPIRNDEHGDFWEHSFFLAIHNEHMNIN